MPYLYLIQPFLVQLHVLLLQSFDDNSIEHRDAPVHLGSYLIYT